MKFKFVEFLCEFFKDEVCKIGFEFGFLYDMVYCYFFFGFGLGVCIFGEVKKEYVDILCLVDYIFIEEFKVDGFYYKISQVFVVFFLVKFVGVVGDVCCYEYVVVLCVVEIIDFMIVCWVYLFYEFLEKVFSCIINEILGISWVMYDILFKLLVMIEWE